MKTVFTKTNKFKTNIEKTKKKKSIELSKKNVQKSDSNIAPDYPSINNSIKNLNPLFDLIDVGIFLINNQGNFVDINNACCSIYGYNKEELLGNNIKIFTGNNKIAEQLQSSLNDDINSPAIFTWKSLHKDGHIINTTSSTTLYIQNDGTKYNVITIKNTDHSNHNNLKENKEIKNKDFGILNNKQDGDKITMFGNEAIDIIKNNVEDSTINKAEKLLNLAEKITHIGIVEVDYILNKRIWSDGCYNLFGLFPKEIEASQDAYEQYLHPEDREQFKHSLNNCIANKIPFNNLETRIIRKDGVVRSLLINIYFTFNLHREPLKLLALIQDISDQKSANNKINLSQKLLSNAEKIAGFGSAEYNLITKESIWSDEFYKILGLVPNQISISPTTFEQYLHPDDKQTYIKWVNNINSVFSYNQAIEFKIIRQEYEERNIIIYGNTDYNQDGVAEKLTVVIQDITSRKKIEKELLESNEKFKSLFYDNPSGVLTFDMEGNITSVNHIFSLKAECTEAELLKLNYATFIHPDDLDRTVLNIENAKKGYSQQLAARIYTTKGNLLDVMLYFLPIIIEKKITGLFCISIDVTEAKNAEIALNKEFANRKSILEYSREFLCELDKEGKFIKVSSACIEYLGYSKDKLIGKNITDFLIKDEEITPANFFKNIKSAENSELIINYKYNPKNGAEYMLEWQIRWDKSSQTFYCITNKTNHLKSHSQILDLSEQHNRYLFNSNPQSLFLIDFLSLEIIDFNETASIKYNYTLKEFQALTLKDFFSEQGSTLLNEMQKDEDYYNRFAENIWMHIKKDGDKVYLNMTGNIVSYKNRRCILTSIEDITEKVNAKLAIKESEEIRKLIMNAALDAIICIDFNEKITFWNPQAEKVFGWKEDEMRDKILSNIVLPKRYHTLYNEFIQPYFTTGESPMLNVLLHATALKKNGQEFPIELTIVPVKVPHKDFFCLFIRDITELKKAESQKEFESRDKEALINSTDNLIWSVNKEYKLIAGNKPFTKTFKILTGKLLKSGDFLNEENTVFKTTGVLWNNLYSDALTGKSFKKEIEITDDTKKTVNYFEISFNPIYKKEEITGVACYGNDITENKLNHNNLIIINTKLKTAQQIASLGYWEVNLNNNKIYLSDELYNIFGLEKTTPDMSIEKMFDLIHPDDRKITIKNYFLTVEGKQPFDHEHRIVLKDGSIKVVIQKGTILYNEKGIPITLEGTAQDITYRKNAEKLIKDSEEKYRMIFNSNPSANWIYDLETLDILEVNNAAIAHYGYSMQEFLNMSIDDIFILKETDAIIEINKEISSYGIMKFGQWHHIKKSGEIINVDITGHAIFYNGKNAVMIVSNDITKILQSQTELANSIERFEYATKATSDAIWDCDLINNTMFWGEGFNILFGYKLKEREPGISSLGEFCHPDDKEKILNSIQSVIKNKKEIHWQEEYRFKKFDGTYVTVSDRALVVRDLNGNPYRIIGAMQDVTNRIQNEKVLKQLNESLNKRAIDLARSNEELEQFAYITSHDLQEPLRMVSSFLTQIQKKYDAELDETGRLYIRFAVDGAVRMRKIILDLLEYSRVGRQLYQYENINTTDLLNEVIGIYRQSIAEKKLLITFKNMPDFFAAKSPMEQLFQNLISNAIKYQQPNSITKINITGSEKDDHWLFAVEDNGIGIDPEYFNKIFVIFQRLHNKDEYSGTGIGLAICKKIVDNHNGKIWVESTFGKGSTFYFTIPKLIAA